MTHSVSSIRIAEAIADSRAAAGAAALIGRFDAVGDSMQRLLDMRAGLEVAQRRSEAVVSDGLKALLADAGSLAREKMASRLVEADALISPTGRKTWLSDAHRAAAQEYNRVIEAHARGEASLAQADSARLVLSATLKAMDILGRPIEQHEKQRKARTASRPFDQADYPAEKVRRAIVLMVLGGDAESAGYLESQAYDPEFDRDGRISCLLDAVGDSDRERQAHVVRLATDILAHDAADYRVELTRSLSRDPVTSAYGTIGDRARIRARGAA